MQLVFKNFILSLSNEKQMKNCRWFLNSNYNLIAEIILFATIFLKAHPPVGSATHRGNQPTPTTSNPQLQPEAEDQHN